MNQAAAEALGELEESQERLEEATRGRSLVEKDLRKAKHEISKLRKNLNLSQQSFDAKSSELLATKEELEHLKSNQSVQGHGRLEVDGKAEGVVQAGHMPEQNEANKNFSALMKEKDDELNSLRKILAEKEVQITSNVSKVC